MAHVLILGGTGQVGSSLARIAEERGHRVTAVHRGRSKPFDSNDVIFVTSDRNAVSDGLSELGPWDIVFDLCAYNRTDVMTFLDRPVHKSCRYILASSIAVYPAGKSWREERVPPLSAYPSYPGCYARQKREAEEAALGLSVNAAVVRLPFVLGGTVGHSKFEREKERARIRNLVFVESPDAALSVIHASDAASFLLALGESRDGIGTWNACSDGLLTVAEYLKRMARQCWDRDLQVEPAPGSVRTGFDVHTAWETQESLSHYSISADWTLNNTRAKSFGYGFLTVEETIARL